MPKLILASASPRRLALLGQIGITPDAVIPADMDETPHKGELPKAYVTRIAAEKARHVASAHPQAYVLSADTAVACGRRILPKAEDTDEVRRCLGLLSGRAHTVLTGLCLVTPEGKVSTRLNLTRVTFKRLSKMEIDHYIHSGEGIGKAGGYGIQGLAEAFVTSINGSYSSVVGLPLQEVWNLLNGCDYLQQSGYFNV